MKEIMKVEGIEKVKLRKKDPSQQGLEFGRDLTNEEFLGLLDGIGCGLQTKVIEKIALFSRQKYEQLESIASKIIETADKFENGQDVNIEYYEKGFDIGKNLNGRNLAFLLEGMSNGLDIKVLNYRTNEAQAKVDDEIDLGINIKLWAEKLRDGGYL